MRLVDLVERVSGVGTVIDATTGSLDLEPYLNLPDEIDLVRDHGESDIGPGALAVGVFGPDRRLHGEEADVLRMLRRLRPGAQALIAVGYPSAEFGYHRLLDDLVAARGQILWVTSLDYTHLHSGLLVACTESLLPGFDWMGRPVPAGPATELRRADEYVLSDFVSRGLRARLLDLTDAVTRSHGQEAASVAAQHAERFARVVRERDGASRALQRAQHRVDVLESRIEMLEGSTSLRLGRVLLTAVRRPGRGTARLPQELYGLWRDRGRTTPSSPPIQTGRGRRPTMSEDALHLTHRPLATGPRRLTIAGVLRRDTVGLLRADAAVSPLLPHDGRLLIEQSHPDAVVVQASACLDGGPWALTGTGAAPDLDRRLNDLIVAAVADGRPILLWRDVSIALAPGLDRFGWDAVLDLDAGVELATAMKAGVTRQTLRQIFTCDAPRVRLSAIARVARAVDPLDQRRVSVHAHPAGKREAGRLIAQVLHQDHRPAEMVVPHSDHGLQELVASGVAVHVGTTARSPWVADWTDLEIDRPPTHLLDLVCAAEGTDADAVGFIDDPPDDELGDYVFVPSLRPCLVRHSLYYSGLPSDVWSRRGYRLLGIRGGASM